MFVISQEESDPLVQTNLLSTRSLVQQGRWFRDQGMRVSLVVVLSVFAMSLGCSERALPPEVPYDDEGVTEIREILGTNDNADENSDSSNDDSDE